MNRQWQSSTSSCQQQSTLNGQAMDFETQSTKPWWKRGQRHRTSDDKSTTSVASRFSLFGGSRKTKKPPSPHGVRLNQDRVLTEFFDVKSVVSDTRMITQRWKQDEDALIEKFFDGHSVQTEIKAKRKRNKKVFSMFRRKRKEVPELDDVELVFFTNKTAACEVPDDEDITNCSGILSTAFSDVEESDAGSSCRDDEADVTEEAKVDVSESTATESPTLLLEEIERSPLKLPASDDLFVDRWSSNSSICSESSLSAASPKPPRRNPVAAADRWSSNSSVCSDSSISACSPKAPTRRQRSKGDIHVEELRPVEDGDRDTHPMLRIIVDATSITEEEEKEEEPQAVTSMHSRVAAANRAAAAAAANVEYTVRRKGVVFDRILIREYARTVGDNPSCSYGPPITLNWDYIAAPVQTVDLYESMKPVKRTKKEFYLSSRKRTDMLLDDWDVSEDDLKWARQEVAFIQYCRERSTSAFSRTPRANRAGRRNRPRSSITEVSSSDDNVTNENVNNENITTEKILSRSPPGKPFPRQFSTGILTSVEQLSRPTSDLVRMASEPYMSPRSEPLWEV